MKNTMNSLFKFYELRLCNQESMIVFSFLLFADLKIWTRECAMHDLVM